MATTSEDARCSLAISSYPDIYLEGRNAYLSNKPCEAPYPQGTKKNNLKRVAWYSGWHDRRREGWEESYDSLRKAQV